MTVTLASAFANACAAYSPANPPPTMTTCRVGVPISVAQPKELPPPPGETLDVPGWGDRLLLPIGGVHPPPEIGAIGEGEEGGSGPPSPAAEGPGGRDQVDREPR